MPDGSAPTPDAAFLASATDLLLSLTPSPAPAATSQPPLASLSQPPATAEALLPLAHAMMEAQAPRPQFGDFATVPSSNPFDKAAAAAPEPGPPTGSGDVEQSSESAAAGGAGAKSSGSTAE